MSRLKVFPPVQIVYPNDRQMFTAEAVPPPALWHAVLNSGDIKSDFSLEVDAAQSQVAGNGGHALQSGLGIVEITVDNQCLPTSTNTLSLVGFTNDVNGFRYVFSIAIAATTVKVFDENNTEIYTESYSTVSGDVYRMEMAAGFRLYRKTGNAAFVLKFSRVNLGTTVIYPMIYACNLTEDTVTGPSRIPQPRLIGDWQLANSASLVWTVSHGSLTTASGIQTEYFAGTIPGKYTLGAALESAADAGAVQTAVATVEIPPLQILGEILVTARPGEQIRFKTNYDAAQTKLVTWSVVSGPGSFTQDEFTAGTAPGISVVRATASVNGLSADITVNVPAVISNASNYTAAKVSEQIDFDVNFQAMPTFVSAGFSASGTGNITPGLPPGIQAGDVLLLFVQSGNQTVSTPSGWSVMADSPQGTGTPGGATACAISVFWKRAAVVEAAPTVTDPGDHALGQILAFRGCISSGNPWDVTSGDVLASQSTSVSIPGDTTTVANCLVVLVVANQTDTVTPQTSGYANANLANLTERTDVNTTAGTGAGFAVVTGEKAAAGAYAATTATLANASTQARMSIALKPGTTTWSASIGSINSTSGIWDAPSLFGQTARIVATNGTYTITQEIPVLEAFPLVGPTAPITVDHNKTVLISTAEDRTRTSRVKDKGGLAFQSREVAYRNEQVSELEQALACWERSFPGVRVIFDDKIRNKRIVAYFDSNLRYEADAACGIDVSFRIREA
jgi:hypothetical protein